MDADRKSVYDVLKDNLKLAKRKTFVHRYIFAGEHKNEKQLAEAFTKIIKEINGDYYEELITGMLLMYPNYFIHLVDGCEEAVIRHLQILMKDYEHLLGETRILFFYHHINQRFFDEWDVRFAKPPILLEKIDSASDFEELKRHLHIFVKKFYSLLIELREVDIEKESSTKIGSILPYMSQFLPEYNLLNFLLHSIHTFTFQYILMYQDYVLDTRYQLETVWPVRADFVPYNVFEKELNPVQDLPTMKPITKS